MASTEFDMPLDNDLNALGTNLGSPSSASSVTGADAFSKINTLNGNIANMKSPKSLILSEVNVSSANAEVTLSENANNFNILFIRLDTTQGGSSSTRGCLTVYPKCYNSAMYYGVYVGGTSGYVRLEMSTNKIIFVGKSFTNLYVENVYGIL